MAESFKCPNCGATIKIKGNEDYVKCEYCGCSCKVPFDIGYVILAVVIVVMIIAIAAIMIATN